MSRAQDIPGKNVVSLDYRRSALPGGRIASTIARAYPAACASKTRMLVERRAIACRSNTSRLPPVLRYRRRLARRQRHLGRGQHFQVATCIAKRRRRFGLAGSRVHCRRRILDRRAGAALYRAKGHDRCRDSRRGVTVWGSMQCPFYVHKALMSLFGLPADKVRVVQQETGGAFGGKEEYPSMIAGHAALLAWKSRTPGEDYLRPRRRHGRDDQAPSFAHAPSHRGQQRRTTARRWTSNS